MRGVCVCPCATEVTVSSLPQSRNYHRVCTSPTLSHHIQLSQYLLQHNSCDLHSLRDLRVELLSLSLRRNSFFFSRADSIWQH